MTGDQLSIDDALGDDAPKYELRGERGPELVDLPPGRVIPSRSSDPDTSRAAEPVKIKAGTQRAKLLEAFHDWGFNGLTDEQAMKAAPGVSATSEFAKRCSELREGGYIEPTGETRAGSAGSQRMVSKVTAKGAAWIRKNR